ncbi:catalase [Pseudoxanthomonas kalamensis DSM 18571]|uniref:catalase family peroxidase n=1 Tax=Pseudoxanthomonas kalamensis TaxID=289483 RepID=UPI001391802D|nr:catalase family peroxidase [Pseudoxanthomonas kalamensis]KAF1712347.1 catalase [Pseudoxanthomonas kalamensis DSM 18571]
MSDESTSDPLSPARRSPYPAFAAIGAIVALLILALAWVAGGITPKRLTAQRLIDTVEGGKAHPGFRRAHSKGVCVTGHFEPSAQASTLSMARVFSQPHVPVLGRLSIAGGDPHALDAQARVRSMALLLKTDDGQQWRTAMNSFPFFSVATPASFAAQIVASRPDPVTGKPDPAKIAAFLQRYPEAKKLQDWARSAPWSNSWANTQFNGVNAFRFIDANGGEHFVRWSMRPQAPFEPLSAEQRQQADADFLAEDLQSRLQQGPLRWDLVVTEAAPGDPVDDPSQPWPDERSHIVAGTLTLESSQPQATGPCRDINYDPTLVPVGIALSDDPVLAARAAAYSVSFTRREREIGTGKAPQATGKSPQEAAR